MRYHWKNLWRGGVCAALAVFIAVVPTNSSSARPKERDSSKSSGDNDAGSRGRSYLSAPRGDRGRDSAGSRESSSRSIERSSGPSTRSVERSSGPSTRDSDSRSFRSVAPSGDSPRRSISSDNPPPAPKIISGGDSPSSRSRGGSERFKAPGGSSDEGGRGKSLSKGSTFGPDNPPPSPTDLNASQFRKGESPKVDRGSASGGRDATPSGKGPKLDAAGSADGKVGSGRGTSKDGTSKEGTSKDGTSKGTTLKLPAGSDAAKTDGSGSPRGRGRTDDKGGRDAQQLRDLHLGGDATKPAKLNVNKPDPSKVGNFRDPARRRLPGAALEPVAGRDGVPLKDASKIAFDRQSKQDAELRVSKGPAWSSHVDHDHIDRLTHSERFEKIQLQRQFELQRRGDVSRQLNLHVHVGSDGWDHRHVGLISNHYRNHTFFSFYWGPSWYPSRCWYPVWSPWVHWSWGYWCDPYWDPRPIVCQPIIYRPCVPWVYYDYPVWQPLPVVASGTWVDVAPVEVQAGYDLQLLAVRFVDPGHPERSMGPRYRVWVRNNSRRAIHEPFNVLLMAADGPKPGNDRLEYGQRVESIEPGQTLALDLRLPLPAGAADGQPRAYSMLHVLVDSHKELNDINRANNGSIIARSEVLPVDPVLFASESGDVVETGATMNLAGEGLGPEPGEVMLQVGDKQLPVEILGWYDLGVRVRVPDVAVTEATPAEFVLVRGDTAATNPLPVQLAPARAGKSF